MVARLSGPSRCYYTHIPSIAARLDGFAFLRSLITVSDPLFCCCIQCRLSGCRVAFVRLGFALLTTLRQPLRALVPDSVPGSQEVSRLSASPFRCRRINGRRFRLLPGVSTRKPTRFLLCAACAKLQAGQLVKGARESAFESSVHAAGQSHAALALCPVGGFC